MQENNNQNCDPDVLNNLITFFYNGTLQYSMSDQDAEKLTWELQQRFLDATVNSELLKSYPVNPEFSRLFFKKLIAILECQQDIHDDFYTYLCSVMKNKNDKDFSYRHYVLNNNIQNIITLKETKNIVVNGTTGLRTWEAGLLLADWALCHKNDFRNKHVLELGSGTGFTSITLAKFTDLDSIMLTDCHIDVLRTVNDNIEINFPDFDKNYHDDVTIFSGDKKSLRVKSLDWNETEDIIIDFQPDILLGADIVYDPSIVEPLCSTIKFFLDKNEKLEVFIANVIRNENTCNEFLKSLESKKISWEIINVTKNEFIKWDTSVPKVLYKLRN